MSSLPSAPSPLHIIRSHSSAISALSISNDNERIYSGDISGLVVITSTRSIRSLASWKAHADGLLGVQEWGKQVITHGRDNKLHVWKRPTPIPSLTIGGGSASTSGILELELSCSLDVNALNFCRFSLLSHTTGGRSSGVESRALIAVPNLIESSLADIWTLPSMERVHAAIGKGRLDGPVIPGTDGRAVKNPTGIIMSMHLFPTPYGARRISDTASNSHRALSLICSYENGSVKLWQYQNIEKERSIEGIGWNCVWSFKLHGESIMATAISLDYSMALSVSADHLIGRYDLNKNSTVDPPNSVNPAGTVYRTKRPGNVCAVGGWDGRVRLFSTKSFKSLGTLIYHKTGVQALVFARACTRTHTRASPVADDEMSTEEKADRSRWLISGGKDGRVVVWALMGFSTIRCNCHRGDRGQGTGDNFFFNVSLRMMDSG
ncbi:WD40 repeat-like protein [Multifurca ochricompacta]|uniref:ASTRA-associated protein 1 n=1 Tax=Multifurca ochricompacta TaxID=376703 RepID=A0AAD4QPY2_9AGAM|nr:WD40 repeat-like protein [Multifurca ochricompacta]